MDVAVDPCWTVLALTVQGEAVLFFLRIMNSGRAFPSKDDEVSKILIAHERTLYTGLASWCVAFEPRRERLEETPPTCRVAASARTQGENLGSRAETKRPLSR